MARKLLAILFGIIIGISLKREFTIYALGLLLIIMLLLILKKSYRGLFLLILSAMIMYLVTNYKVDEIEGKRQGEFLVTEVKTNYVILKNDRYRFVCYPQSSLNYHCRLKATGNVTKLITKKSHLVSSFNDYLFNQGVFYEFEMTSFEILNNGDTIRPAIKNFMLKDLEEESQAMISLILFNDKSLEKELYDELIDLSVVQLFVISGFHLNILGGVLGKMFGKKRSNSIIPIVLLLPYVYLINFTIPVVRAFLYLLGIKLIDKFHLPIDKQSLILIIAIILLIFDYHIVFSLSFQLTFLVSFIICQLTNIPNKSILFRFVIKPIIIQASVLPLIMLINYQINPLSFIYNTLLSIPVTILYLLSWTVCFIKILDIIYFPFVVGLKNLLVNLSAIDTLLITGKPSSLFLLIFYLSFVGLITSLLIHRRKQALIYSFCLFLIVGYQTIRIDLVGQERVVFLDVGQGDATLICGSHNKYNILIDTGGSIYTDIAKRKLIPFLKASGIRSLDLVIITHEDYDHYGALESLKENYEVDKVVNGWEEDSIVFEDLFLKNLNRYYSSNGEDNEKSAVLTFEICEKSFLIMGDAPIKIEEAIMLNKPSKYDILRLGHHGSKTSSSPNFLRMVDPIISIISVGKNSYGLPDEEVLELLENKRMPYYRTDVDGNIQITSKGVIKNL